MVGAAGRRHRAVRQGRRRAPSGAAPSRTTCAPGWPSAATGWVGRVTAARLEGRARSRSRRSPASCPRTLAARRGARRSALDPVRRRTRPTPCSSCAGRGSTRARCAARPGCRSAWRPPRAVAHADRGRRRAALHARRQLGPGHRPPPSSSCRACEAHGRTLPVDPYLVEPLEHYLRTYGVDVGPARGRAGARCASSTTRRSRASAARAPTTARPSRSRRVLGGELHPVPARGVAYVLDARRTFLADEQGLGKTVQALAALEADDAYPAVVVCPASLKLTGRGRRALAAAPHARPSCRAPGPSRPPPTSRSSTTTSSTRHRDAAGARRPRALVLDESHYVKNPRAKRTQALRRLADSLPPGALRLALTGTPVINHAEELIPQLRIIGRLEDFGSGARFARRFQGIGAEERIHWHLRRRCFVRRLEVRRAPPAARQAPGRRPGRARQRARVPARRARRDRLAARAAARPARARPQGGRRAAGRAARPAQRAAPARVARQVRAPRSPGSRTSSPPTSRSSCSPGTARCRSRLVERFPDALHLLGRDTIRARDAAVQRVPGRRVAAAGLLDAGRRARGSR